MKTLSVRRGTVPLLELPLSQPKLYLGRSPVNEGVIRAPGVRSVHWLIEWVGAGEFDAATGSWVLVEVMGDIEGTQSGQAMSGQILAGNTRSVRQAGLEFELIETGHLGSVLSDRLLSAHVKTESARGPTPSGRTQVLEVIDELNSVAAVQDVSHQSPQVGAVCRPLKKLKWLKVKWIASDTVQIDLRRYAQNIVGVLAQGVALEREQWAQAPLELKASARLELMTRQHKVLMRFVPKIQQAHLGRALGLTWNSVMAIGMSLGLGWWFANLPATNQPVSMAAQKPPPERVVRVMESAPKSVVVAPPAAMQAPKTITPKPPQKAAPPKRTPRSQPKPSAAERLMGLVKNSPTQIKVDTRVSEVKPPVGTEVAAQANPNLVDASQNLLNEEPDTAAMEMSASSAQQTAAAVRDQANQELKALAASGAGQLVIDMSGGGEGAGLKGEGCLAREVVKEQVQAASPAVRVCYERALIKTPGLKGRVVLKWQIKASGDVGSVSVESQTLKDALLTSCLSQLIGKLKFPVCAKGLDTEVRFPFEFKAM